MKARQIQAPVVWDPCISVLIDLLAGRRQCVPLGPELVEALPLDVPGLLVARVGVERVAGIRDDVTAVLARAFIELRLAHAVAGGGGLAGGRERRPDARACPVAGRRRPAVLLEQVE